MYLQIKEFNKNYENILIYNDFPIIKNYFGNLDFNKLDNVKNYIYDIDLTKDVWYNNEVKKDNILLNETNNIYFFNYNGILFKYNDFIRLFEYLDIMIKKNNCKYPFLEIYIPTFIKNKFSDIKVFIIDYTIWDKNSVNFVDDKYFSVTYKI